MAETKVVVNYTEAQTAFMVKMYQEDASIAEIAMEVGKSERSVIAKLVNLGLYKSPKVAEKRVVLSKADMVIKMAESMEVDPDTLISLAKADKAALTAVFNYVVNTRSGFMQ